MRVQLLNFWTRSYVEEGGPDPVDGSGIVGAKSVMSGGHTKKNDAKRDREGQRHEIHRMYTREGMACSWDESRGDTTGIACT